MCKACALRYWQPGGDYWTLWPRENLGRSKAAALSKLEIPATVSAPRVYVLWPRGGTPERVRARNAAEARSLAMSHSGGVSVFEQAAPGLWVDLGTVSHKPPGSVMVEGFVCKASRGPDLRAASKLLASNLREHDRRLSASALEGYLERLDVNWDTLSASQTDNVLTEARTFLSSASGADLLPSWQSTLEVRIKDLSGRTKQAIKEDFAPSILSSLSLEETKAVESIATQSGWFLRDALGRRSEDLTDRGRVIVAQGLKDGLGRDQIGKQLREQLPDLWQAKGDAYSVAVASVATQRARVATEIYSYQEAGIEQLAIVSVLDERTTDQCRLLNGQILSVAGCVAHLDKVAAIEEPEEIYSASPFLQIQRDKETGRKYMQTRGGARFAELMRSGRGVANDRGLASYSRAGNQMLAANVGPPPYHFRCRTTTEPILTTVQVPHGYVARAEESRDFGMSDPKVEFFPAPLSGKTTVMGDMAPIDWVKLPDPGAQARAGQAALRRTSAPAVVERYAGRTNARTLPKVGSWTGTSAAALAADENLWRGGNAFAAVVGVGAAAGLLASMLSNDGTQDKNVLARVLSDGERWARMSGHDSPGWSRAAAAYRRALEDPEADHEQAAETFMSAGRQGGWLRTGQTAESVRFKAPEPVKL